ncbi:MAG: hypothetical protein HRF43_00085 [Phycisphaerae bacterium]|jgi:hypothetical protein
MNRRSCLALPAGVLALAASASAGWLPVTIDIYAASGPDIDASPTWSDWWNNAHSAVHHDLNALGGGNSAYLELSDTGGISAPQAVHAGLITGFDSWQGTAGGSGEFGQRVHFIYSIRSESFLPLSLARISGLQIHEDGWAHAGLPLYGSPIAYNAATTLDPLTRVAYASDGTLVTSGTIEAWDAAHYSNPIYQIVGTFGFAYLAGFGAGQPYYQPGDSPQDTLDRALDDLGRNLHSWTGTAVYDGMAVQTTVQFVPEPATLTLLAVAAMLPRKRRHRR